MKGESRTPPHNQRGRRKKSDDEKNEGSPALNHSSSSQIRLQGSARIIKDHCADWNNYMDRWEETNDQGFQLANKIINLKLQKQEQPKENILMLELGSASEKQDNENVYPEGLEELSDQLTDHFKSMKYFVAKMCNITAHLIGVQKLESHNSMDGESSILFKMWTIDEFCETSKELEAMYRKEIKLKQSIVEDIAHQMSRDLLMTYISLWHHEPYLEERRHLLLQSLLLETGWKDP